MPSFGISVISIIPVRVNPSEKSEMSSQLLFGEIYEVIDETEKWVFITTKFDNYQGWIDKKMHFEITTETFNKLTDLKPLVNQNLIHIYQNKDYLMPINILPGSSIYLSKNSNEINFDNKQFYLKNDIANYSKTDIKYITYSYLNSPYLWGGRTPFGIDCSGFSQVVYKIMGIPLPRDASQQAKTGKIIEFIEDAKTGDLAFFDNAEGQITHVGIILENNKIIHASGIVRIDQLDHQGIFNKEKNLYSHKLRIIKRLV
ncbi:MAG: C40 family peptidase [Chlorobi bacterium]|nr:C40 family peptidase [Chlorobiota bacterium]